MRTLRENVCPLTGGLDVARFGEFGTWAIWSCGETAGEPPAAAAQQANISDPHAQPLEYPIAGRTAANDVMWNPDCTTSFLEDGVTGSADELTTGSGRDDESSSFHYHWPSETTANLGPGRMANHFARVAGSQLSLNHPKGVGVAAVSVWEAPDEGEIFAVGSTLTGVPVVCER